MALIKCPECGHDVSTKANVCMNCGYPIAEYMKELNSENTPALHNLGHLTSSQENVTNDNTQNTFTCPLCGYNDLTRIPTEELIGSQKYSQFSSDDKVTSWKCNLCGVKFQSSGAELLPYISCPNCGSAVRFLGQKCITCGFDIPNYRNKMYAERLVRQVLPTEFKVAPGCRAKVCVRCGASTNANGEPTCNCKFPLAEVDYPVVQTNTYMAQLYILENQVIPRNICDKNDPSYQMHTAELYQKIKKSEEFRKSIGVIDWKLKPEPPSSKYFNTPPSVKVQREVIPRNELPVNENTSLKLPKCPICGSTNLSKISNLGKAIGLSLFGIGGADNLGKTWKCENCGSKF